jgi:hypothetical protein
MNCNLDCSFNCWSLRSGPVLLLSICLRSINSRTTADAESDVQHGAAKTELCVPKPIRYGHQAAWDGMEQPARPGYSIMQPVHEECDFQQPKRNKRSCR